MASDPDPEGQSYFLQDKKLEVGVRDGVVTSITYYCGDDYLTSLNQISCGSTADTIAERFKERVRMLCRKRASGDDRFAPFLRVFDVPSLGTRYVAHQNKIYAMYVTDSKRLESLVDINSEKCQ
jgi:hypothetical protein